jgi:putative transposase
MRQGFLYLIAVIDWATRRVLSWRLSNTLTAGFCVEALSEALGRFGKPGIFNTDQSLPSRTRGARNSPVTSSPRSCAITGSRSAWMDAGAATTTSSSSACGGP